MTQSNFLIPHTVLEKFKFPQEWCQTTCAQLFLNQGGSQWQKRWSFSTDLQRSQFLGSLDWDLIKIVLTRLVVLIYNSIWFIDKKFLSSTRKLQELTQLMKKWAQPAWHHSWGNLNFLWTVRGMTKWFWVTIEGYLSYILPKFEHFGPTGLGSGALYIHARNYTLHPVQYLHPHGQSIKLRGDD